MTDGQGIPLATILTGASEHDVTQLIPLIDRIPALQRRGIGSGFERYSAIHEAFLAFGCALNGWNFLTPPF